MDDEKPVKYERAMENEEPKEKKRASEIEKAIE